MQDWRGSVFASASDNHAAFVAVGASGTCCAWASYLEAHEDCRRMQIAVVGNVVSDPPEDDEWSRADDPMPMNPSSPCWSRAHLHGSNLVIRKAIGVSYHDNTVALTRLVQLLRQPIRRHRRGPLVDAGENASDDGLVGMELSCLSASHEDCFV